MSEKNIEHLISKTANKFLLANAAAGRAMQISDGSLPYVSHFDPNNPIITALREIAADKIQIKVLSAPKKTKTLLGGEAVAERPSALQRLAKDKKSSKKEKKK